MANNQLITKLQRELKRNPKKTALLALGLLVACYFWAPLVAGWFGGGGTKKPAKPQTAAAAPTAQPQTVAEGGAATTPQEEEINWEAMLIWIQEDPYMVSAQIEHQQRDPFAAVPEEIASQLEFAETLPTEEFTETEEQITALPAITTPQSAGLQLSGILAAGGGNGWARISGETYQQGAKIGVGNLETNGAAAAEPFVLEEIHATFVVLSRDGENYELAMPAPALQAGGRINYVDTDSSRD